MVFKRLSRRHKGYSSPSRFRGSRGSTTFSNYQMLVLVALVISGVSLLMWFLNSAKGAW